VCGSSSGPEKKKESKPALKQLDLIRYTSQHHRFASFREEDRENLAERVMDQSL